MLKLKLTYLFLIGLFFFTLQSNVCVGNSHVLQNKSINSPIAFASANLNIINPGIQDAKTAYNKNLITANKCKIEDYFCFSSASSEKSPFINLNFSCGNVIPDFVENLYEKKLGLDKNGLFLFTKHSCSSIAILSFKEKSGSEFLNLFKKSHAIIVITQLQI